MSYPSLPGYHSNGNGQVVHNHQSGRDSANSSDTYPNLIYANDTRPQGQYVPQNYQWGNQNSQMGSQGSHLSHGSNKTWRNSQISSYDYQRQPNLQRSASPATSAAPIYRNTSRSMYEENTQGLNSLAYASGLEPANQRLQSSGRGASRPTDFAATADTTPDAAITQVRVKSPTEGVRYSSRPQLSFSARQAEFESPDSSRQMAADAAAALAAVVSSRYGRQAESFEKTVSSSNVRGSPQSVQTADETRRRSPSVSQVSAGQAGLLRGRTTPQGRVSKNQQMAATQIQTSEKRTQPEQAGPSTQHISSIANLVTAPDNSERTYESSEPHEAMPHFIDPTRVFNPYHREHERKKREAAEAEAKRRAEEENRIAMEQTARRQAALNSQSQDTPAVQRSNSLAPPSGQSTAIQAPGQASEEEMAAEMKAFMEKMKNFRTQDPATFARLWKSMSGKEPPAVKPNAKESTPLSQVAPSTLPTANSAESRLVAAPTVPPAPILAESAVSPATPAIQVPEVQSQATEDHVGTSVSARSSLNRHGVETNGKPSGKSQDPGVGGHAAGQAIRGPSAKRNSKSYPVVDSPAFRFPGSDIEPIRMAATALSPRPMPQANTANAISSFWTEALRKKCAVVATQILKAIPGNESNSITEQDIEATLEHNPSYADLCAALELRGLQFNRNFLATNLLLRIPELRNSTTTGQASNLEQPASNHVLGAPYGPMGLTASSTVRSETITSKIKPPKSTTTHTGLQRQPPPGSKEAAARKRDFSELVDLTSLSDNENYVKPDKKQYKASEESSQDLFHQSEPVSGHHMSTVAPPALAGLANGSTPLKFNPHGHVPVSTTSQPVQVTATSRLPLSSSSQPPHPIKNRMIVAKKMDRSEALEKSYYDPRTVARDILIASGRHPSERPLNVHLAGMINQYIELESDVSTLDWDAIDPGGPPLRQVEYVDIPATHPKFSLRKKDRRTLPDMIETTDATRIPKADKRDPTSRSPPPPDPIVKKSSNSNHVRPSNDVEKRTPSLAQVTPSSRRVSINIPTPQSSTKSTRSTSRSAVEIVKKSTDMEGRGKPTGSRRGRPPGSKNKHASLAALRKQAASIQVEQRAPSPVHQEYKCKWVKCNIQLHNLATLRRHVLKRHVPSEDDVAETGYVCWWKRCSLLQQQDDGIVPSQVFDTEETWFQHVESEHIQSLGFLYGDGPNTAYGDPQKVERDRRRYLSDGDGRLTTPAVALDCNPNLPNDTLELTRVYVGPEKGREEADIIARKAYMRANGAKSNDPRKHAVETVRAMQARKERIGPGIDRGGCTLINEARRSTFQQSPGIARIVDADY